MPVSRTEKQKASKPKSRAVLWLRGVGGSDTGSDYGSDGPLSSQPLFKDNPSLFGPDVLSSRGRSHFDNDHVIWWLGLDTASLGNSHDPKSSHFPENFLFRWERVKRFSSYYSGCRFLW